MTFVIAAIAKSISRWKLHLCLFSDTGIDLVKPIEQFSDQEFVNWLISTLQNKGPSHLLREGNSGGNKNFSLIGG